MPSKRPRSVKTRRSFTKNFKLQVSHEVEAGTSNAEATRGHDLNPETIRSWRDARKQAGDITQADAR
jgi:transposase-like protein